MNAQSIVSPIKADIRSKNHCGKAVEYMTGERIIDHMNEVL